MNQIMTVREINGIMPHCETVLPNSECPYLKYGCTGCMKVPYEVKVKIESKEVIK
jgi:hypothetical protein